MTTSISRKERILLETPLRSLQRGQLTPAAAVLVCRERGYVDLQVGNKLKKKRGAWVAHIPDDAVSVLVDRRAWQNLVREQSRRTLHYKLRELKKTRSIHSVYVLHAPLAIWQSLSLFSVIGVAAICGHLFMLSLTSP